MLLFLKKRHFLELLGLRDSYGKHLNDVVEIAFIVIAVMNYELQKQENIIVFDMILNLKLYQVV
jgi:hypothetical protein